MIDYTLPLDRLPDPLPIEPLRKPFDVTITPPGSKSITCRAYVLAALAKGESKIIRPLRADDTDHLLNALCTLGAEARWVKSDTHDGEDVHIKGVNGRFPKGGNLYMGDGGAPTRFMIACACLAAEPVVIDASPRMRERPIAEGVDMLRQLGAQIEYVEEEGRLPVRVVPANLKGGKIRIGRQTSSQFVSALMLIGTVIEHGIRAAFTAPLTSESYLLLTAMVLDQWGVKSGAAVNSKPLSIVVKPGPLVSRAIDIDPDASSAMYWLAAAATCDSGVAIPGLRDFGFQPDSVVAAVLKNAGGTFLETKLGLRFRGSAHRTGIQKSCMLSPDASLTFAAIAPTARGQSRLTGLRTLRVKETDRIAALANELRKVGCTVETGEDWIAITPPAAQRTGIDQAKLQAEPGAKGFPHAPVIIETYNDHRMAMSFAILGLNPPNGIPLAIRNPKCVAKSYPTFWKDFAKLYGD